MGRRGSEQRRSGGGSRSVLIFLSAFLLASVVLRQLVPPNPDFVWHATYTAKIEHLREATESYDVVFVGNSTVYLGIDPVIVEASLAEAGCPGLRTYNLGSVAQTKFEFDRMMAALETTPGGTPEFVVSMDHALFEIGLLRDNALRHRVHMRAGTWSSAVDYIRSLPTAEGFKGDAKAADLIAAFALQQIPVGAVHQQLFAQEAKQDEWAIVNERQGFKTWPVINADRGPEAVARLFARVERAVASGEWERRWNEDGLSENGIERWLATIDANVASAPDGATAVHALIPSELDGLAAAQVTEAWRSSDREALLLNLVDEALVGDFTEPAFWSDDRHVSQMGSERVSHALGAELCPVIRATQGAS